MTQYPEIFNGGREFEGFVLRALAGVAYKDATVTMAIKTDGPSLAITMSSAQARLLAFELLKMVGGNDQQDTDPTRPVGTN